ncbi:MAG TPA: metallophosphoesterase [Terriglobia bacterium]|nr:metallophosphoesterase [Terriglobia bacterium]
MSDEKPFQTPGRKLLSGLVMVGFALIFFWAGPLGRSESVAGKSGETRAENESLVKAPDATWTFAISGDSRNCGDVVMPAIAAGVQDHHAAFYWHLGDFRLGSDVDQDMAQEEGYRGHHISLSRYASSHWADFIQNQLLPFGKTPVFLAIGNHELHFKTEKDYLIQFATWLNTPIIRRQRLEDNPTDYGLRTYYHWKMGGVAFFSLDNASGEQFDEKQIRWFESVLKRDESDPDVHTIVLGMHRALPHSVAHHSMDESALGVESGSRVYQYLLHAEQQAGKHVYVFGGHLHAYVANVYNTDYWKSHGGVLPGWILGTAGATRANLSENLPGASEAITNVYGYVLGTVNPQGSSAGTISFKFYQVKESDVPRAVVDKFTPGLVNWCFEENHSGGKPAPAEK